MRNSLMIVALIVTMTVTMGAQVVDKSAVRQRSLGKSAGSPSYGVLNVNNITTWARSDGNSNHSPSNSIGATFLRRKGHVIYQDGIIWGGKAYTDGALTSPTVNGQRIRVGGGTYLVGTQAGSVSGFGNAAVASDTGGSSVRMFRIRRDYYSMSDQEVREDAADVYEREDPADVTPAEMDAVRAQYALDWMEWPVANGAPFIDRDGNGVFDPPPSFSATFTAESLTTQSYDEPGFGTSANPADQVLWTAFNDLNVATTRSFAGAYPLGLEIQKTIWAYKRSDALGNVYFTRHRIVNVGGVDTSDAEGDQIGSFWIDSMYVAQWTDSDVGSFSDDLIGCDSLLNVGFAYNGSPVDGTFDMFNLPPPAVGYDVVGGPVVSSPGDTAVVDRSQIANARNLGMMSFAPWRTGDPYTEPPAGINNYAQGTGRWWKVLRGYAPLGDTGTQEYYYSHPPSGPSFFPYSGDPISATGWIDGQGTEWSFPPGDQRFAMPSGPFTLAPADTQEVVFAVIAGMGADRLSSLAVMKSYSRIAQALHDGLWQQFAPTVNGSVSYPSPTTAQIHLESSGATVQADSLVVTGYTYAGSQVFEVGLYDDGAHADGMSDDGIFGGNVTVPSGAEPVRRLWTRWTDDQGRSREIIREDILMTRFEFPSITPIIVSDHLNSNGEANPGENIRLGLTFGSLSLDLDSVVVDRVERPSDKLDVGTIGSTGGSSKTYNVNDPVTYLDVDIPLGFVEDTIEIPVRITDKRFNSDLRTLKIPVVHLPYEPRLEFTVDHASGRASGSFAILRVYPDSLKDHQYSIEGSYDQVQERSLITVKDLTLGGLVLLQDHELPDSLGHNMPVIDGFKILRGTIGSGVGLRSNEWTWSGGTRFMTWVSGNFSLEEFGGAWGWMTPAYMFGATDNRVNPALLYDVQIVFSQTDSDQPGAFTQSSDSVASYAYRYLRNAASAPAQPGFAAWIVNAAPGYPFQDYRLSAPLAAYNIDKNPPQRLAVAYLENNAAGGLVDGFYWPPFYNSANGDNIYSGGPREWLFLLNSAYTGSTPNLAYQTELISDAAIPVLYWGTWTRRNPDPWPAGHSMTLRAHHPVGDDDMWTFNPSIILAGAGSDIPVTFSLMQNFPNPFNPTTKVRYTLPMEGRVTLRVYNLIGQRVADLVSGEQHAGVHEVEWNASSVASGMYFYRLELTAASGERRVQSRKMMLLK